MAQQLNRFKVDLREIQFAIFEHLGMADVLSRPPYASWGEDECRAVLSELSRFCREVVGPTNAVGDREACRFEGGRVYTPEGFKEAWRRLYDEGWQALGVPEEHGGQGAPRILQAAFTELLSGANAAFAMYPGLAFAAAELIENCGTPEQTERYARPMFAGKIGGTMCLTEPHAGSDVGAATSSARPLPDGTYAIQGTKIFISCGDHDLTDDIVHLVLARIDGAAIGTKGLSLFIVPTTRDGKPNDVKVASIEHKMGIKASSTCVLAFGEDDACVGELVGGVPHQGMKQMFRMMNYARIAVGLQSLGVASSAYLNALEYARERKQGASVKSWKDATAPRATIVEHPDVRRMLIDMKARVEGLRALIYKLALHGDRAAVLSGKDDETVAYHLGQVELLTPLVKAWGSDQAFRIAETAIQVYGGAGYLQDHPVEQYCRDAKIFSIYEGTNHIQALDLVGRKLGQGAGRHTQEFLGDVAKFIERHKAHPVLGPSVAALREAHGSVGMVAMQLLGWFQAGEVERVPLAANRFLAMMADMAVGWLLLDQAAVALEKQATVPAEHPDHAFYEGKRHAAVYFAQNVLPDVAAAAKVILAADRSALDIPETAFATV
ncbi:MAG: acyl-CoA dehydrogenase [Deltaproteobacteria bacterium]|nr:acyl-CoA dehydrogenase [Deltaproteobacteria bacterium]